jgi:hypothetical protein
MKIDLIFKYENFINETLVELHHEQQDAPGFFVQKVFAEQSRISRDQSLIHRLG